MRADDGPAAPVAPGGAGGAGARGVPPGEILAARGPRAVEEALLAEVLAEAAEAAADLARGAPGALARPIRVVVPSRSLREGLCASLVQRVVQRAAGALVGVAVQTLDVLAREVLERAGETTPPFLLQPVAVREAARREPALARELGELVDGYAPVVASVDDLLDAGLTPALAEAVGERLAETEVGAAARERAAAVLRVAATVAAQIEAGRLGHRSARLARAAARLADDPDLLPCRRVWIHGFADATGVQADLLEALVRRRGARVWLDLPRGTAPAARRGAEGAGFGARLRERLAGQAEVPVHGTAPEVGPPRVTATRHPHPDAEACAAAAWARDRLEAGGVPERIAVVARDLSRYRLSLRRHLGRLGVPFSGLEEPGASRPAARPLGALEVLLRLRGAAPAERWLDALARVRAPSGDADGEAAWRVPDATERSDWLHAVHTLGAATLDDLAALGPERFGAGVRLTARRGLAAREGAASARDGRRRVPAEDLVRLVAAARACRDALARLPERAPLADHRELLRRLAARALGWPFDDVASGADDTPERGAARALAGVLAELDPSPAEGEDPGSAGAAASFEASVSFEDWMALLAPRLAEAGRDRLGGDGAGVLVLSVMEARGRGFDDLWVLGMNRGVFPRRFSEDPLLPDALRRPLRDVLPDLPLKGAAPEEERFLFAQLLEAAPRVRVSCARCDERGRQTPASPLLDRVAGLEVAEAPEAEPRSLHDHVLRALRDGPRDGRAPALAAALAAARRDLGLDAADPDRLARARLAVLGEIDAPRRDAGPYLGFVGAVRHPLDPRHAAPYVTQLEDAARCPWRAFLRRLLRVEPPADALDALPAAADPRLLGNAVHAALERLADPGRVAADASAAWPATAAPESLLRACAERVLDGAGRALPGYANALARRAAPYVEVARALALADPGEVLAVEEDREVVVRDAAGRPRSLRFKTDLVERELRAGPDGARRLRLTDYKTGSAKVDAKKADRRRAQYVERLSRGELLQAHAYTLATPEPALGRYLYLSPDLDDSARALVAEPDGAQREAFDAGVAAILDALDHGALPPRLRAVDRDEEPGACRTCEVKLACLRGDSGARRRLGAWAEDGAPATAAERAALGLWRLGGSGS